MSQLLIALCIFLNTMTVSPSITANVERIDKEMIEIKVSVENPSNRMIRLPGYVIIDGFLFSYGWNVSVYKNGEQLYINSPLAFKMGDITDIKLKPKETISFTITIDLSRLIDSNWQTMTVLHGSYSIVITCSKIKCRSTIITSNELQVDV